METHDFRSLLNDTPWPVILVGSTLMGHHLYNLIDVTKAENLKLRPLKTVTISKERTPSSPIEEVKPMIIWTSEGSLDPSVYSSDEMILARWSDKDKMYWVAGKYATYNISPSDSVYDERKRYINDFYY